MIETPAIQLRGVTKRFGQQIVLDNVSIEVSPGQVYGLLGPNGAGKSTIIKILVGLMKPNGGDVQVFGMGVLEDHSRVKERIGYVPELQRIYQWMRVSEVIAFARGLFRDWDDGLCGELLDRYTIPLGKKVRQLSKGMATKLGLLVALCHKPDVLVLDEPMSGLDPVARDEFLDHITSAICSDQLAVLLSSHLLSDVQRVADTVGILRDGRLIVQRSVEELLVTTRRVRVVLQDGSLPRYRPDGIVWERLDRREWLLTVSEFSDEKLDNLRQRNPVTAIETTGLGLEELYKDFVRGGATLQ